MTIYSACKIEKLGGAWGMIDHAHACLIHTELLALINRQCLFTGLDHTYVLDWTTGLDHLTHG